MIRTRVKRKTQKTEIDKRVSESGKDSEIIEKHRERGNGVSRGGLFCLLPCK